MIALKKMKYLEINLNNVILYATTRKRIDEKIYKRPKQMER